MSRIFITGSSDGLGSLTAQRLISQGHRVVLHARSSSRAKDAESACPGAETTVIGDLSTLSGMRSVADQVNKLGRFDAVVHNAGLYTGPFRKTADGLPSLTAVNTVAPYVLTCLIQRPKRLVFVSSGLHQGGDASLQDLNWKQRGEKSWNDSQAYADSKLHNIMLASAFARKWNMPSHSVDPGWVKTKMGGASAMDDLDAAVETFAMVAAGDGQSGKVKSEHWYQKKVRDCRDEARDVDTQEKLLGILEGISGVKVPQ